MKTYTNPDKSQWEAICTRPVDGSADFSKAIEAAYTSIQDDGDDALKEFTKKFDKVELTELIASEKMINSWSEKIDGKLAKAIDVAYENITKFHKTQLQKDVNKIETSTGVECWREVRPIDAVGLYIPGGSAPLFSTVLMLGIPAQLANCQKVILCTPPQQDGSIHPAICYAAKKVGITHIFRVGGAQAIIGMAVGTESIPKVDKIFGPGNQFVTEAKMQAQKYGVAIDMPAGPSEVMVVADKSAQPQFVAADLLSQAEHGPDSQVVLVATSQQIVDAVQKELAKQLKALPRQDIASEALKESRIVIFEDMKKIIDFVNVYAPEHLILSIEEPTKAIPHINNAGSVFLGNYTPESAGDYASGTNHTLPTNGWARTYSGLSVESFSKYITFQSITQKGAELLAPTVAIMAKEEGLDAHKNAMEVRL